MEKDFILKTAIFILIIVILFIIAPIFHIFIKVSSENLINTLRDRSVWESIFISIWASAWATIIGCIVGIPFSYVLSRSQFRGKGILESIINLPVAIPHVAVGIALLSLFNPKSAIGRFFSLFHISFVDTVYGIIIAMLFVSLSFIISSSVIGFSNVDKELEMVSRSLGASMNYTFWHITFPLAFPAILRGAVLAFARSMSEVGALLIIAYYPKTASILMYERFEEYGLNMARPVTAIVIVITTGIFLALFYFTKRYAKGQSKKEV